MKRFATTAAAVIGIASAGFVFAQPGVDVFFTPISGTQWEVTAAITGDTSTSAGLSSYSIFVTGVDSSLVSYAENTLGTIGAGFAPIGFSSNNLVSGDVAGDFNAGNFQAVVGAIFNIGETSVNNPGIIPGTTPLVDLGVPALLGTLTTPEGLGAGNFLAGQFGLFNEAQDGFFGEVAGNTIVVPEPASIALLGVGLGLCALRRRRV